MIHGGEIQVSPVRRMIPALFVYIPIVPKTMMNSGIRLIGPSQVYYVIPAAAAIKTTIHPLNLTHVHWLYLLSMRFLMMTKS